MKTTTTTTTTTTLVMTQDLVTKDLRRAQAATNNSATLVNADVFGTDDDEGDEDDDSDGKLEGQGSQVLDESLAVNSVWIPLFARDSNKNIDSSKSGLGPSLSTSVRRVMRGSTLLGKRAAQGKVNFFVSFQSINH